MAVLTSKLIVELLDRLTGPARRVSASMTALTAAAERNSARLTALQGKLLGAAAAGYGLAKSLGTPISAASQFETSLLNIGQKADMSDEKISAMGKRIRALAPIVNKSALEVAKGIDALVGFGLDTERAETLMGPIGRAATAYQAEIEDLSKAGFAVLDNLKVKAEDFGKALDVMAQSGKDGAFEIKDMAAKFPELTAAASALEMKGIKAVGRLSAALQIARKGAGTSAEAATNTGNLMQKIISPETTTKFKKVGIDIRKELEKTQATGGDVFEMIDRLIKKATKGNMSKIGDFFQDSEVQKFLRPLWQNIDEYRRIRDEALRAAGVVDKDFQRRMLTNAARTEAFKIRLEGLSMTIGNILLPSVNRLLDALSPVILSFEKFAEANPGLVGGATKAAAALIALRIAGIAGKFALGWLWGGALAAARVGLIALGIAGGPVSIVLTAIGAAAVYAYNHWQEVLALWQRLKEPWLTLGDTVRETMTKIINPIKTVATEMYEAGANLMSQLWEGMKAKFAALLGWVSSIPGKIKGALGIGGGGGAAPEAAGARAAGGPVQRGKRYLVGERGPELWQASGSGRIIDTMGTVAAIKAQALAGARSGGGNTMHNSIAIHVQAAPGQSTEAIAEAVERKFSAKLAALSRGAYSDGAN